MDSQQNNKQDAGLTNFILNRRSFFMGSAGVAATAVAGPAMGLLDSPAMAESSKTATSSMHSLEDFPGGV